MVGNETDDGINSEKVTDYQRITREKRVMG